MSEPDWNFTWTPRRRWLLNAALDGRVSVDAAGRFWLDMTANITVEFKPFIRHGLAREPDGPGRVVWFAEHLQEGFR